MQRGTCLLALVPVLLGGCNPSTRTPESGAPPPAAAVTAAVPTNATLRFEVTGMHCEGCALGIRSELARTPGVGRAVVTFADRRAVIDCDTNQVTEAKLVRVIVEAGYQATRVDETP